MMNWGLGLHILEPRIVVIIEVTVVAVDVVDDTLTDRFDVADVVKIVTIVLCQCTRNWAKCH